MNASLKRTSLSISSGFLAFGFLQAQPAPSAARSPVSRGLPRLADTGKPGAVPLAVSKFAVDDLSSAGSAAAARSRKAGLDVLTVGAGTEWSRPLRGLGRESLFVSFLLCATESTIIEIAGARLGVTLSPADGYLQSMFDEPDSGGLRWRSLGLHAPIGKFAGEERVSLPLLTVHLDPVAGVWSLYAGMRLVAASLPLITGPNIQHKFTLKAGKGDAWVCQLIMADENPLYEDENANGIDDAFERQRRGFVLAANASPLERRALAEEWRTSQRALSPPPLFGRRPVPDDAPTAPRRGI